MDEKKIYKSGKFLDLLKRLQVLCRKKNPEISVPNHYLQKIIDLWKEQNKSEKLFKDPINTVITLL